MLGIPSSSDQLAELLEQPVHVGLAVEEVRRHPDAVTAGIDAHVPFVQRFGDLAGLLPDPDVHHPASSLALPGGGNVQARTVGPGHDVIGQLPLPVPDPVRRDLGDDLQPALGDERDRRGVRPLLQPACGGMEVELGSPGPPHNHFRTPVV
jgi:hypothetical protein